jgi:hypothetical protein
LISKPQLSAQMMQAVFFQLSISVVSMGFPLSEKVVDLLDNDRYPTISVEKVSTIFLVKSHALHQ